MTEKLYLTERQDIIGAHANRVRFADLLVKYGQAQPPDSSWQQIGVWVLIGMTGRWQKTLALWEWADGWDGFSRAIEEQMMHAPADLAGLYKTIEGLRSGGECYVMKPGPGSPTAADLLRDGISGSLLSYETVHVRPGAEVEYLAAVASIFKPIAEKHGYKHIGSYSAAKIDGTVFTAWALERADHVALMRSPQFESWQQEARQLRTAWQEELWISAAGSKAAGSETAALF